MKQQRKDFILELHKESSRGCKVRIEKEFPKLFKSDFELAALAIGSMGNTFKYKKDELVVGKWYKVSRGDYQYDGRETIALVRFQGFEIETYGFNHFGNWTNTYGGSGTFSNIKYTYIPATNEEVSKALIAEAKRRGYKNGNYKCMTGFDTLTLDTNHYYCNDVEVWINTNKGNNLIFREGVWAEIIEAEKPVYEWQYVYICDLLGCQTSIGYYTSKKEFKKMCTSLDAISKVKASKRIRK